MFQSIKKVGKVLLGISVLASGGYTVYGSVERATATEDEAVYSWTHYNRSPNTPSGTPVADQSAEDAADLFECDNADQPICLEGVKISGPSSEPDQVTIRYNQL